MENNLMVIDEREVLGKEFRIYGTVDEPLFLAKDVAEWIEYDMSSVNKMLNNVDEGEKLNGTLFLSGQNRQVWFLTEDGLYEVLMQSRKPIAKAFKKEVKVILKQIRIEGGYVKLGKEEDFININFPSFSEETKRAMVNDLYERNKMLQQENEEMRPKVEYHDRVLNSDKLVTTSNIAKDLGMSAIKLNKILHEKGIIFKQGGSWKLYAKYEDRVPKYCDYTITEFGQSLKWTEKGRQWIIDILEQIN